MSKFDVLVWGATGFTGQLVVEYLVKNGPRDLKLALGGRSKEKLEQVKSCATAEVPSFKGDIGLLVGDSQDADRMAQIVSQARVVATTVGPYALYGKKLVEACAKNGVHYVDLTGEPSFIRHCLSHQQDAESTGALIVNCCGFDSIPSDIGTFIAADHLRLRGRKVKRAKVFQKLKNGAVSGGTIASAFASTGGAKVTLDPYLLCERRGRDSTDVPLPGYDKDVSGWVAPFFMAPVNGKVVRRSSQLLSYGDNFSYKETMGPLRLGSAIFVSLSLLVISIVLFVRPLGSIVKRFLPKPGEGPTKEQQNKGSFTTVVVAEAEGEPALKVKAKVAGQGDAGYLATSKMISEAALCLALERDRLPAKKGGVYTPAAAFGNVLVQRLKAAGFDAQVEP